MSLLLLFGGGEPAPPGPAAVPFFVTEPETLSVSLEVTGGQSYCFGPNREDEGDIALSIEWSTQNPGGFADGAVTLARPPWISAADAPLMASYKVTNQGGELRYQGRTKAAPQVDATTIRIEAEGLAAALDDNEYWRFLGVHNDLTAWGEPSVERQQALIALSTMPQLNTSVAASDTGLPALATRLEGTWEAPQGVSCEGWLDTAGMDIAEIRYGWQRSEDINVIDDLNWAWGISFNDTLDTAGAGSLDTTGNLWAAGPDEGTLTAAGAGRRYATVLLYYAIPSVAGGESDARTIWWHVLSAFGTHGLTPVSVTGDDPGPQERWGLLDRDIIEFAVSDGAPDIPMSAAFIDSGDFVIPHIVHTGTVRELIEQITVYGGVGGRLNDWGVFESFFHRAPGWGETWRVRRDEVEFSEGGPTTEGRCTGMVVTYTDGAGREHSVGPPDSGADYETASLDASSPLNPVEKTRVREGGLTSRTGAINIGVAALAEANAENRRGQVTITDTVRDSAGNERPTSVVRACDYVVIEDEAGGYPPETQPVVGTNYSHDTLAVSCELGLPAPSVEALLARLAARTPT
jgi:hypothetical protein